MSSYEFDQFNDFLDFENTNDFLNTLSGVTGGASAGNGAANGATDDGVNQYQSQLSPASLNDDEKIFMNQGFNGNGNSYDNYYPMENYSDFNGSSNLQTSSMSSQNDSSGVTPVSQPSMSSTYTSPESNINKKQNYIDSNIIKEESTGAGFECSESDDESPRKSNFNSNSKVTKPRDKSSHNKIERKYRVNINSKINMLKDAVPSLRMASGDPNLIIADLEGLTPARKLNKASILTKATEYIQHLEKKNEMLRQQNQHLQKLIQEANLNPQRFQPQPQHQQQQQPPQQPPQQPQQQPRRRQVPQIQQIQQVPQMAYQNNMENSYNLNSVYNIQQAMPQALPPQNIPQQQTKPNKYLLGGMAAVAGTSLFGGPDSDFRGLSAVPFMPYSFAHPSPVVLHLWSLLKVLLFVWCLGNLILPDLFKNSSVNRKKMVEGSRNVIQSWIMVSLGLASPEKINEDRKTLIITTLLGKDSTEPSIVTLLADYMYLSSCESTFENCVLNLLVGCIIQKRNSIVGRFLNVNLNLKAYLVRNLDYKGDDKSLAGLQQFIKELDGLSFLRDNLLITRLNNLISKANINRDISDDSNYLKYIEIYKHQQNDLYSLVASWRVLEIVNQLIEVHMSNLTLEKEEQVREDDKLCKQVDLVSQLLSKEGKNVFPEIENILENFKAVLQPSENALELMKSMKTTINNKLENFKFLTTGPELTDDETIEVSESEEENVNADGKSESENIESEPTTEANDEPKYIANIESHKKLIESLNLVDQEQFFILNCALINYYYSHNFKSNAFKLLNHFRFGDDRVPLSLLSFTALFKVIDLLISKPNDGDDNSKYFDKYNGPLEKLVRVTRLWLNDNETFMTDELRGNISDIVVSKGMILNGTDDDNNE